MITRSLALIVLGFGAVGSITAYGQARGTATPPVPPSPPAPLIGGLGGPGVKTNRTQLFSSPVNPRFVPPSLGVPPSPQIVSPDSVPLGRPSPLGNPPRPIVPPQTAAVSPRMPTQPPSYIVWDAESKEYNAKPGESSAHFTFYLTNVSKEVVMVNSVHTSCGCTVAQLPEQPWRLQPGTNGPINVTVNLAGKIGTIVKSVSVETTTGTKSLLVKVNIPSATTQPPTVGGNNADRLRNMQMAMADRQAVFKNDCATCHAKPAIDQSGTPLYGAQLYAAVCSNCHDSPNRAAMVPDLKKLNHPTGMQHWHQWIASGKAGSMMPAFAKKEGGPLDDQQITSLAKYLTETISGKPQAATAATTVQPVAQRPALGAAKPNIQ